MEVRLVSVPCNAPCWPLVDAFREDGLQGRHANAAGSKQDVNRHHHPSLHGKRQQDVSRCIGHHAKEQGVPLAKPIGKRSGDERLDYRVNRTKRRGRHTDCRGVSLKGSSPWMIHKAAGTWPIS